MSYLLPERASTCANPSLMPACDRTIASACCFLLLIRSGSFMYGPMVTGLRGSTDVAVGEDGARETRTTLETGEDFPRRFWGGGGRAAGDDFNPRRDPRPRRGGGLPEGEKRALRGVWFEAPPPRRGRAE